MPGPGPWCRALGSGPASVALKPPRGPQRRRTCDVCANICTKTKYIQSAFKRLPNVQKVCIRMSCCLACLGGETDCFANYQFKRCLTKQNRRRRRIAKHNNNNKNVKGEEPKPAPINIHLICPRRIRKRA